MDAMSIEPDLPHIGAVIAAAGLSRRMGSPKQLLPWGNSTVIASVVEHLQEAGAKPILVVTGHRHDEVVAALSNTAAQTIYNIEYATAEMLSSYQVGLRTLATSDCAGVLLALGDQPHIPVATLRQLVEQAQVAPDAIVIPSYAMRRGHPFYMPRALWPELLALSGDETLRTLVARHHLRIVYVTVDSDAILHDMDTPTEFAQLKAAAG